jgi:Mn2+/Fe2+ NRAMP family transporter
VATLVVVGATTAYGLSWLTLLLFPMLAVVQAISSHVGIAGRGNLQTCVARRYGRTAGTVLAASVLLVCVITAAADLQAAAAALGLLTGVADHWFVIPIAVVLFALLAIGAYDEVQRVLQYVLLLLLAYVVTAFLASPDWGAVARGTFNPGISFSRDYAEGALALLGTTLTSYVYIWQSIENSEERVPLAHVRTRQIGSTVGIAFAVGIFWFILLTNAATLGTHHQHVQTAQQAAEALRPLAGAFARQIFAIGLLASAVVALPVILATCAYVVAEEFDWERGLSRRPPRAPRFYVTAAATAAIAAAVSFGGVSPIRLLFIASLIGGLATPIGLVYLLRIAGDHRAMNGHPVGRWLLIPGWIVAAIVSAACLAAIVAQIGS